MNKPLPTNLYKYMITLESGELWVPGALDGYVFAPVLPDCITYNIRKCGRRWGRSMVLFSGTLSKCMGWMHNNVSWYYDNRA